MLQAEVSHHISMQLPQNITAEAGIHNLASKDQILVHNSLDVTANDRHAPDIALRLSGLPEPAVSR